MRRELSVPIQETRTMTKAACLLITLTGLQPLEVTPMPPQGCFSVMLGEASPQYPRNSEGDVVALRDGRLLACWTRFYGGAEDDARAEIAARLSGDGGRTWGAPFVLQENVGTQNVMSASFLRERESGALLFFYGVKNSVSDMRFYCWRSNDEGESWDEPVLVTPGEAYFVINNARIVQLRSGRLLAPTGYCQEVWTAGEHFRTVMFYSDDAGRTWHRAPGEVDAPKRGAMEPGVVELRDGRVLQIIRTQMGEIWKSYSSDEGLTWDEPRSLGVVAPEAPSTIARIPTTGDLVLFHNPEAQVGTDHCGPRTPLSVSISHDEGETWQRTIDIETDRTKYYAYLSCTFWEGRALLTYYVSNMPYEGGVGLSQKFVSLPVEALYGAEKAE